MKLHLVIFASRKVWAIPYRSCIKLGGNSKDVKKTAKRAKMSEKCMKAIIGQSFK